MFAHIYSKSCTTYGRTYGRTDRQTIGQQQLLLLVSLSCLIPSLLHHKFTKYRLFED